MRDLLFAVASAAALAMANPATAQMYLPPSPGVTGPPSYTPPGYTPTPPELHASWGDGPQLFVARTACE